MAQPIISQNKNTQSNIPNYNSPNKNNRSDNNNLHNNIHNKNTLQNNNNIPSNNNNNPSNNNIQQNTTRKTTSTLYSTRNFFINNTKDECSLKRKEESDLFAIAAGADSLKIKIVRLDKCKDKSKVPSALFYSNNEGSNDERKRLPYYDHDPSLFHETNVVVSDNKNRFSSILYSHSNLRPHFDKNNNNHPFFETNNSKLMNSSTNSSANSSTNSSTHLTLNSSIDRMPPSTTKLKSAHSLLGGAIPEDSTNDGPSTSADWQISNPENNMDNKELGLPPLTIPQFAISHSLLGGGIRGHPSMIVDTGTFHWLPDKTNS